MNEKDFSLIDIDDEAYALSQSLMETHDEADALRQSFKFEEQRHRITLEAQGESQIALLHKQLDEERQANVELRQANIAIKTIAEDSQKDAKSAKIFAWISVGIGAAALIVAIIALLV
jgi:tRNA threonylcarbamoyladenosine modification (KEOPS) complex  Pcc1 subunit